MVDARGLPRYASRMNQKGWLAALLLVFLLSALPGCGKDKNAVLARGLPGAMAPAEHGNSQGAHEGNPQPVTSSAEQLFGAQYKYVNLVCSTFAIDAQALAPDATPTSEFSQQVFPALGGALNQIVQSPSGKIRATFSVATTLSTATLASGVAPVIIATATAAIQFNGAPQGSTSFPGETLWVSTPANDTTLASVSLGSAADASGAQVFGTLVIRCHLEGGAVSGN